MYVRRSRGRLGYSFFRYIRICICIRRIRRRMYTCMYVYIRVHHKTPARRGNGHCSKCASKKSNQLGAKTHKATQGNRENDQRWSSTAPTDHHPDGAMAIAPNAPQKKSNSSEQKRKKRPRATEKRTKNGLHAYMERARPGTSPQSTPNLS